MLHTRDKPLSARYSLMTTGMAAGQFMQEPEALFSQRRQILPEDTDSHGIVYSPRIANCVVEIVEAWFAERLSVDLHADGPRMVFASLSCTFLSPMRPGDMLEIRVALGRVGRSSLGFEIVGHREADDRLCWMAETVCVFIDAETFKSRLIPEELRAALQAEVDLAIRFPFGDRTLAS